MYLFSSVMKGSPCMSCRTANWIPEGEIHDLNIIRVSTILAELASSMYMIMLLAQPFGYARHKYP